MDFHPGLVEKFKRGRQTMKKTWIALFAAITLTFCFSVINFAQDTTGSLTGTVKDANGAAVAGATVNVLDPAKHDALVRTVTTNDDGVYSVPNVIPATYTISVEAPNFKKSITSNVVVEVGKRREQAVTLEAGRIEEAVTVEAEATAINLSTPTAATTISGDQVRELSLNNRNYVQLITLSPGVSANIADQIYVGSTNPNGQSNALQIAVNGVRSSSNTYTVDGADTTDRGANLTVQTYPSVDAIQEFSVLRSLYPAESGRSAGGQVNVITKSGTSKFHGSLFEFVRNDKLNANTYLINRTHPLGIDENGKAKRAPFRYNNFGGTIGGPLPWPHVGVGGPAWEKNNTFFFFSEEVRRVILYPSLTSTVPDANQRQGIFSQQVCVGPIANQCSVTATSIPQATWSPLAAAYVQDVFNKLPLPDSTGTLFFPTRGIFNFRQDLLRIDHRFSDKVSAYYRFENDSIPTIDPNGTFGQGGGQPFIATASTNSPGKTHVLRGTWSLNPHTIMEAGAAYSWGDVPSEIIGLDNIKNSPNIAAHLPAFPFATTRGRIPTLGISPFSTVTAFGPYSDFSFNKSAFVSLTKIFGGHTTKYGFNFSRIRKHENSLGGFNEGRYTAASTAPTRPTGTSAANQNWANFLLGVNQVFTQNQFDLTADLHADSYEAYAQDEWRVKQNLTIYYGGRLSRFGQPWDGNGRMTSFSPFAFSRAAGQMYQVYGNGQRVPGTGNPLNGIVMNSQNVVAGGTPSPFGKSLAPTRTNFAPRFGIAWDPFKKGTTSIRAGYGIYFDQLSFSFEEVQLVATNPPFQQQVVINGTTLDNPLGGTPNVNNNVQDVGGIDPNFKTPYVQSWSLDVQHQFGQKNFVTVGYYGSRGVHLTGRVDLNNLPAGYAIGLGATACAPTTTPGTTVRSVPCQAPGQVFTTAAQELILNQIRPFPGYGVINYLQTAFNSNYHSLQVTAQRRFTRSSQVNLAYTWSKNLTDSQNESGTAPQNTYDLKSEYARANLDRRHVLSINYIYELPFFQKQHNFEAKVLGGWQVSGIVYYYSGLGFSATTSGFDYAGLGFLGNSPSGARPFMTCDPNQNGPRTFGQWFDTSCFTNPSATSGNNKVGNEARNVIVGPPTTRFDATLAKNIRLSDSMSLQLRWELFNVFNHTNFTTLALASTTPSTFGSVTGVRDPRQMQLGIKFIF
jgi:hypothetical protein